MSFVKQKYTFCVHFLSNAATTNRPLLTRSGKRSQSCFESYPLLWTIFNMVNISPQVYPIFKCYHTKSNLNKNYTEVVYWIWYGSLFISCLPMTLPKWEIPTILKINGGRNWLNFAFETIESAQVWFLHMLHI